MWPYCGHFEVHKHSWLLACVGNWLAEIVSAMYRECYFKSKNLTRHPWILRIQSKKKTLMLNEWSHSLDVPNWPVMLSLFWVARSTHKTWLFGVQSLLHASLYTTPYRFSVEDLSNHIRHGYRNLNAFLLRDSSRNETLMYSRIQSFCPWVVIKLSTPPFM